MTHSEVIQLVQSMVHEDLQRRRLLSTLAVWASIACLAVSLLAVWSSSIERDKAISRAVLMQFELQKRMMNPADVPPVDLSELDLPDH